MSIENSDSIRLRNEAAHLQNRAESLLLEAQRLEIEGKGQITLANDKHAEANIIDQKANEFANLAKVEQDPATKAYYDKEAKKIYGVTNQLREESVHLAEEGKNNLYKSNNLKTESNTCEEEARQKLQQAQEKDRHLQQDLGI